MQKDKIINITGQVERVTFSNEETGYTVAKVRMKGRRKPVTVVGTLNNPLPGEILQLSGSWFHHPKYGEQFKAESFKTALPVTTAGIEKYLGSGLIKGIGPVMAKRVVSRFKKDTLKIIEQETEKLAEVDGIGKKRALMIKEAWDEQKEVRSVMMFLQTHGVTTTYAAKIYKRYGNDAIALLQENPYRLATDIFGIGFLTADRIATRMGFGPTSNVRVEAGLLYVLNQLAEDGHVCYPYLKLRTRCAEILEVGTDTLTKAVEEAKKNGHIFLEDSRRHNDKMVYLSHYYVSETNIAVRLHRLLSTGKALPSVDIEKALDWVQKRLAIQLAARQIEAVKGALKHKVLVITGGPGTGKTTIIKAILKIFAAKQASIMLAAPTGRAAKRMAEAAGFAAKTIHRLLQYSIQRGGFQKNDRDPLLCDMLVIDEASMVDTLLLHHLLKALPAHATLVLVGDINQLPSVGAGYTLGDIIASGVVPVVHLNEIFRQARESSIIVNSHLINEGKFPRIRNKNKSELDDFYFIEQDDPQKVLEIITNLVQNRIPRRFGFDPLADIQVLTPMHKGLVGSENLNHVLQNALNTNKGNPITGGRELRINDKVMQIRNNYEKDVYNGDIGRVIGIDEENQEINVLMDDRHVSYALNELDELTLAYAVSVHKSQGSEYPAVVVPLLTQHYILLQRNLVYTAVTRGKKLVVIVGTKKAFAIALRNNKTAQRYSLLQARLAREI